MRDREAKNRRRGIAVFVLTSKCSMFCVVKKNESNERCWLLAHTDDGPVLLACWYRPPHAGNTECIETLAEELKLHRTGAIGTAIIGDVNVHSKRWLKYSPGESPEGTMLQEVCMSAGLKQIVTEPTRNEYLLDLVMTDIPGTEAFVGGKVQDHRFVLTKFNFKVPETQTLERQVWNYGKADWTRLKELLADHDWENLRSATPSAAALELTNSILEYAPECIG